VLRHFDKARFVWRGRCDDQFDVCIGGAHHVVCVASESGSHESTGKSAPTMYLASSETRNETALATSSDVRIQRLYRDDMVPIVRKDHPWGKRRVTPERLAALEYVAVWTKTRLHEAIRPTP